MKAFIERICILFQMIVYGVMGYLFYQDFVIGNVIITSENGNELMFFAALTILVPTGIRWMLTGKFQPLPISSKQEEQ